jgi:hypothetical protein
MYSALSPKPYRLSRSGLELFLQCARCFFLDRRLGIRRPGEFSMSLYTAVDQLLKREFDAYRARGEQHPVMTLNGIDAVPFTHPDMEEWRDASRGIRTLHEPTNFSVYGAVDDVWVEPSGRLMVADYKATSSAYAPGTGGRWAGSYARQLETYQWILRRMGYEVSAIGYLVFANADRSLQALDGRLNFSLTALPVTGNDSWVDDALVEAKRCLDAANPPPAHPDCEWCAYRRAAQQN